MDLKDAPMALSEKEIKTILLKRGITTAGLRYISQSKGAVVVDVEFLIIHFNYEEIVKGL